MNIETIIKLVKAIRIIILHYTVYKVISCLLIAVISIVNPLSDKFFLK